MSALILVLLGLVAPGLAAAAEGWTTYDAASLLAANEVDAAPVPGSSDVVAVGVPLQGHELHVARITSGGVATSLGTVLPNDAAKPLILARAAADTAGDVLVVWGELRAQQDPDFDICASVRSAASGTWSPTHCLGSAYDFRVFDWTLDPAGRAVFSWGAAVSGTAQVASMEIAGGVPTWHAASELMLTGSSFVVDVSNDNHPVDVAIAPDGTAAVAWVASDPIGSGHAGIVAAVRRSGAWSAADVVAPVATPGMPASDVMSGSPQLAADARPGGSITLAMSTWLPADRHATISASTLAAAGGFPTPTVLATQSANADSPVAVAIRHDGAPYVVWRSFDRSAFWGAVPGQAASLVLVDGGVHDIGNSFTHHLVAGDDGSLALMWRTENGANMATHLLRTAEGHSLADGSLTAGPTISSEGWTFAALVGGRAVLRADGALHVYEPPAAPVPPAPPTQDPSPAGPPPGFVVQPPTEYKSITPVEATPAQVQAAIQQALTFAIGLVINANVGTLVRQGIVTPPVKGPVGSTFINQATISIDPRGGIPVAGGGVITAGGANVITLGGGNVITAGGANVITLGGGNVITAGGGNVITAGGGNVITAGGANVITIGGGNMVGRSRFARLLDASRAAHKPNKPRARKRILLLATGGFTFHQDAAHTIPTPLTPGGRKLMKSLRAMGAKARKAHRAAPVVTVTITTIAGTRDGLTPAVISKRTLKIRP